MSVVKKDLEDTLKEVVAEMDEAQSAQKEFEKELKV